MHVHDGICFIAASVRLESPFVFNTPSVLQLLHVKVMFHDDMNTEQVSSPDVISLLATLTFSSRCTFFTSRLTIQLQRAESAWG